VGKNRHGCYQICYQIHRDEGSVHRRSTACISCRSRRDKSARIHLVSRLSHFSTCVGRHSYSARNWGRQAGPAPAPTPDSRSSEIAPPPHSRTSGAAESKSPSHSGFRRASHAFLRFQISRSMQKAVPQGHATDRTSQSALPKSCFVAFGARSCSSISPQPSGWRADQNAASAVGHYEPRYSAPSSARLGRPASCRV
jgi:hypothetical protein